MYLLTARRDSIRAAMARAAEEAAGAGALPPMPPPAFGVEVPRDDAHGDFACNLALLLAPQVNLAPRAVAEALRKLLVDPALRRRMGVAARRRAVGSFDYARLAPRLAEALSEYGA